MEVVNLIGNYPECKDCPVVAKFSRSITLNKGERRVPHVLACRSHRYFSLIPFVDMSARIITLCLLHPERLNNVVFGAKIKTYAEEFVALEPCPAEK